MSDKPQTTLCRGGRPIEHSRARPDMPDDPFLGGKTPGWQCPECSINPGTRGPLARQDCSDGR